MRSSALLARDAGGCVRVNDASASSATATQRRSRSSSRSGTAAAAAAVASSRRGRRGADQRAPRRRDHRADRRVVGLPHRSRIDVARRGARAARARARAGGGHDVAITPDGPRGPARVVRARRADRGAARRRADHRRSACRASTRVASQELGPLHDSEAVRASARRVRRSDVYVDAAIAARARRSEAPRFAGG